MRPRCWGQEGEWGHGSREGWSLPIRLQLVPWLSPTHHLCPGVPSAVSQLFLGPGRRLLFQSPMLSSSLFGLRPGAALPHCPMPQPGKSASASGYGSLVLCKTLFHKYERFLLPSTARKPPRISGLGVPSPLPSLPEHILAQGCLMWGRGQGKKRRKGGGAWTRKKY